MSASSSKQTNRKSVASSCNSCCLNANGNPCHLTGSRYLRLTEMATIIINSSSLLIEQQRWFIKHLRIRIVPPKRQRSITLSNVMEYLAASNRIVTRGSRPSCDRNSADDSISNTVQPNLTTHWQMAKWKGRIKPSSSYFALFNNKV